MPLRDALKVALEAVWRLVTLSILLGDTQSGRLYVFTYRKYPRRDPPLLIYYTLRAFAMLIILIACAASAVT